jgi:hypothetical protein
LGEQFWDGGGNGALDVEQCAGRTETGSGVAGQDAVGHPPGVLERVLAGEANMKLLHVHESS